MNDDVIHKWLMLDKDVAAVLMSMDQNYWKNYLRRDGKILVKLDKIMYHVWLQGGIMYHVWLQGGGLLVECNSYQCIRR